MTKLVALLVSLAALSPALADVTPLTKDSAAAALVRGHALGSSDDICRFFDGIRTPMSKGPIRAFAFLIETPTCAVALRAFEAKRKFETLTIDQIEIPPTDQQSVILRVDPSSHLGGAFISSAAFFSGVAKVVLKRGAEIIQPTKSEFRDVTFSNAYGKTEVYKGGSFWFPLSAFDPAKASLQVVIVPEVGDVGGEAVKTLTVGDLKKLQ